MIDEASLSRNFSRLRKPRLSLRMNGSGVPQLQYLWSPCNTSVSKAGNRHGIPAVYSS